jgi:hypothetical protein
MGAGAWANCQIPIALLPKKATDETATAKMVRPLVSFCLSIPFVRLLSLKVPTFHLNLAVGRYLEYDSILIRTKTTSESPPRIYWDHGCSGAVCDVRDKSNRIALLQKAPSFGFDNLISGLTFIDFLQYFGEENARKANGYGIGMDYFDLIVDKDPKFFYSYFFMSITGSIYSGQPERSVALMNKGFKSISLHAPEASYYLWRLKGSDELLFLGNSQAAIESMLTAADWARKINDAESLQVGEISRKTAEFLAKNPNSKMAQFASWAMVLENAVDINARKIAVFKIRELGGKVELDSKGEPKLTPPPQD